MPKGIYKRTEEHNRKVSLSRMGRKMPEETKNKLRLIHKRIGSRPPSRLGCITSPETKEKQKIAHFGKKRGPMSEEGKRNIAKFKFSRFTPEVLKRMSIAHLGKKMPIETRIKMSQVHKNRRELSKSWRGGITPINNLLRRSVEYKLWRESVFRRDDWTCVWCERKGEKLNADHIKPFAYYPELRFDIKNGRTLCVPCHRLTDTFSNRAKKYEQQFEKKTN